MFWIAFGPNWSAGRTPLHGAGGCGGRQRSGPTGGAAKGTPLYTVMPRDVVTPASSPPSTRTGVSPERFAFASAASRCAAPACGAASSARAHEIAAIDLRNVVRVMGACDTSGLDAEERRIARRPLVPQRVRNA